MLFQGQQFNYLMLSQGQGSNVFMACQKPIPYDQILQVKAENAKRAAFKPNLQKKSNCIIVFNGKVINAFSISKKYKREPELEKSNEEHQDVGRAAKNRIKRANQNDPEYSVKNQKKDRNVISNIIHHFFRYATSESSLKDIQQIIFNNKLLITIHQAMAYIKTLADKFKAYISQKNLANLWQKGSEQDRDKNFLIRCLSFKFLRKDSFLSIFDSNKLNKNSKKIHYQGRRQLISFLVKGSKK